MRTSCCAAALLLLATSLRAEVVARAITGTVVAFEAPSADKPGKMVVRHTRRDCGKLVTAHFFPPTASRRPLFRAPGALS